MIFRQFFDAESYTYTYLLADRPKGQAILIDPVYERAFEYTRLLKELQIKLVMAVDTHIHADHITALDLLHHSTQCDTAMGSMSKIDCVTRKFSDGEILEIGSLRIKALYTPGHTDDSYSFVTSGRVFTGDTLLIRSTGRTDFQNGDPAAQYDSLFNKILRLPPETLVYPAHDYYGMTVSSIGEELLHNPRLQVSDQSEYVAMMNDLVLSDPQKMDVAIPANHLCGVPMLSHQVGL